MQPVKHLFVLSLGVISALYLLNLGVGFVEVVPDNLPLIGNLDEATAAFLLLNCLDYFGIDIGPLRKLLPNRNRQPAAPAAPSPPKS